MFQATRFIRDRFRGLQAALRQDRRLWIPQDLVEVGGKGDVVIEDESELEDFVPPPPSEMTKRLQASLAKIGEIE